MYFFIQQDDKNGLNDNKVCVCFPLQSNSLSWWYYIINMPLNWKGYVRIKCNFSRRFYILESTIKQCLWLIWFINFSQTTNVNWTDVRIPFVNTHFKAYLAIKYSIILTKHAKNNIYFNQVEINICMKIILKQGK